MTAPVTLPLWFFVLIVLFAAVTFASHFLFPSVRWFFRRRMQKAVDRLNERLDRPIEPFRLLRRYDLIQRILYDPEVTQAIVDHAKKEGIREDVAFQRAQRYAKEIVPSFSAFAYFGWGVRLARWLSNALYRVRLAHHDEEALSKVDRDATVVFVMNHRSNMDYVLVTHLAADRSALSYAVGEWAQVWPLSGLIRMMGAYFIRRKSRNALYRMVLRRYVQMSTAGGVTQAIFPEGGLSLNGAVQPPKMGLLTYMVDGLDLSERDVVFVPVALNYDRVLEDRVLIAADKKGGRRFDAKISHVAKAIIRQLWLRVTGRFHRFGYAAVSFGAPVSLRDAPELAEDSEALAERLIARISALIPVLPVPLIARLLLNGAETRADLEIAFSEFAEKLQGVHMHVPRDNRDYAVEVGLRALLERGLITEDNGKLRVVETDVLQFYANSIEQVQT
ncbi:1-acyl-sn-glycerol-3-phosphate acyltransferase [Thalassococcus lentus]|uniref:Glycerol-3-phosphate acyltransferase n=1 Tax=Thalassococcus lentus TaxID=1210524 RepID=A0ABT4XWV9_9RHOB|nr:1-acyl-sn-glycerol-3-phosphate acyltransferase [Thalassococcus lentus]MDA7426449.1 1-acyl-sn-glycerol-3-phosphate acyltransferase [Thalassococcus lentus]